MVWGCLSWHGVGTIVKLSQTLNAKRYIRVLDKYLVHYARELFILR